jgi:hypothetical protein
MLDNLRGCSELFNNLTLLTIYVCDVFFNCHLETADFEELPLDAVA